jgi:hypothetical protein
MPKPYRKARPGFWSLYRADILFILSVFLSALFFSTASADQASYENGGRRDPFIPLIGPNGILTQKISTSDLNVEGIIYDPSKGSLVLVNGEFYKQGDSIGVATVITIFKDRVIFKQEDEEKTIWIREEIAGGGELKNEPKKDAQPV